MQGDQVFNYYAENLSPTSCHTCRGPCGSLEITIPDLRVLIEVHTCTSILCFPPATLHILLIKVTLGVGFHCWDEFCFVYCTDNAPGMP